MSTRYIEHLTNGQTQLIKYSVLKRRGIKNLTLRLASDNSIKVSAPLRCSNNLILEFIQSNLAKVLQKLTSTVSLHDRRKSYLTHKKEAFDLVSRYISEYREYFGDVVNRIRIKDTKSLWGSCSSSNNLNFNYKIVFLPPHLQRYIVVHELCHLKELNHSPRYWELVGKLDADYLRNDAELKNYRASEMY